LLEAVEPDRAFDSTTQSIPVGMVVYAASVQERLPIPGILNGTIIVPVKLSKTCHAQL
jgi:hypothetical protein